MALDQLGCECWQAIKVAIRPPVLDRHVLCLDVAGFSEASSKAVQCMLSEHFGRLAWQFKRVSGSSGLKVQAAIAC